ncbi:MAG: tRNA preQ1(34) S-adenosylmethionine ribosyltransferase-isomerase QueA [Armatimonadetes bacterium]|nr:tRNA preQ1(34) S-adenosylmethionine ribosyltransferase-isomerase QueA [Armatimonadota bacterium]
MRLEPYDYELPPERIAQEPVYPRDSARLLTVARGGGVTGHRVFRGLPELLAPGDVLVVNETRVSAVRLLGTREGLTGEVEALLLRPAIEHGGECYEALVRPGRKIGEGERLVFAEAGVRAEVIARGLESGGRILRLTAIDGGDVTALLETRGRVPLPPYITAPLSDRERYQTVYAKSPGSAAAPTAGLHFTPELLQQIRERGVRVCTVRLDVGLGTFRPIKDTEDVTTHEMHAETYCVSAETADAVNACTGRVVAVGTTSLRSLESAALLADAGKRVAATEGETRLFVLPGYKFRAVDALVTNFHQPHSTLLLLVAAFVGAETMREAYRAALESEYRFLSFGDAMFAYPAS